MKVLITTDARSGVWQYTAELARQLDRLGHDIVVASFGGVLDAAHRGELTEIGRAALYESDLPAAWDETLEPEQERRAVEWLRELVTGLGCDVLHCNDFGPAAHVWDVPSLLVIHSCRLARWRATHRGDPGPEWAPYRAYVAAALEHASHTVVPSRAFLAELRTCYPQAEALAQAGVIYNGVDASRWPPGSDRDRFFVLGVGCLADESKNLAALAAAAEELTCPVLVAGACAGDRARGKAVMLKRLPRARLAAYYRRAQVFAHPARHEPFGLPVLEAALSGCALVLGDIAALRELWGPVASFVDPSDARALREAIERLTGRAEDHAEAGRRARHYALRYSAHTMALHYLAAYRALLGRNEARALGE